MTSAPISRSMNIMQDSKFLSANKMFEAKCKLYTKEMNLKPRSDFEFVIHLACIIKTRILDIIWPCLLIIMIMT